MKLRSDDSILRLTHEGVNNFSSLSDFVIENFPRVCKSSIPAIEEDATNSIASEASVSGGNVSSISVSRLIAAVNSTKHWGSISRTMNPQKMAYSNVLVTFKIDHEAYLSVKDEDSSKVPKIDDRDKDRKTQSSRISSRALMDHEGR